MSVFAKTRQLFEPVSMPRKNVTRLAWASGFGLENLADQAKSSMSQTAAVWLAILGSVLAFSFGRDFERPKVLCLSFAAALILPRAVSIWPALPRQLRIAVLIWLLALGASVVFSLDPARALIGSFERSQGALVLVCCTIFALARVPVAQLVAPVSVAAIISGVWALVQFSGFEALLFSTLGISESGWHGAFGWRAFASFGNPTALASWLAIALTFLFFSRFQTALPDYSARMRRLLTCALFFAACGVLASGTRAAWMALVIVALLQLRRKKWVLIVGLTALVPIALAILSLRVESVQARFELAGAALSSAKITRVDALGRGDPYPAARFWLGTGPDLQVVVLEQNLPNRVPGEMPDRAHQMLLDGYLSIGLLGVSSWLWLMTAVWLGCGPANKGVIYALIAGLITWQFGFALSAEKALCALLLGSMYVSQTYPLAAPPQKNSVWINVVAGLLAAFSILSYAPKTLIVPEEIAPWRRPERAIAHFERARAAIVANRGEPARLELTQAVALDPWRSDLARANANLARELGHARQ